MTKALWSDEQEKPLQHLRIVDTTVGLSGPYLTRILAQYGADIVKVEGLPQADPLRKQTGTCLFDLLNQGKRSLAVNLAQEEGAQLVRQLAAESDVFIENSTNGEMDRFDLGYAELSEENPDLIYVSLRTLSGKVAAGWEEELGAIAQSGVGDWHREGSGDVIATAFAAIAGGVFHPAIRLLTHLANPSRRGMHLLCSMEDAFRALYLPRAYDAHRAETLAGGARAEFGLQRQQDGHLAHTRYYCCRDNQWVALAASSPERWQAFCEAVEKTDWVGRYQDTTLHAEVAKLFLDAPASYWESLTTGRPLGLFRIIPWQEHHSFTQARANLNNDPLSWVGFAPNADLKPAPLLGADSYGIARSLGYDNKQLSDWLRDGTISQPTHP